MKVTQGEENGRQVLGCFFKELFKAKPAVHSQGCMPRSQDCLETLLFSPFQMSYLLLILKLSAELSGWEWYFYSFFKRNIWIFLFSVTIYISNLSPELKDKLLLINIPKDFLLNLAIPTLNLHVFGFSQQDCTSFPALPSTPVSQHSAYALAGSSF